jgi:hypothetical protein
VRSKQGTQCAQGFLGDHGNKQPQKKTKKKAVRQLSVIGS